MLGGREEQSVSNYPPGPNFLRLVSISLLITIVLGLVPSSVRIVTPFEHISAYSVSNGNIYVVISTKISVSTTDTTSRNVSAPYILLDTVTKLIFSKYKSTVRLKKGFLTNNT